MFSKKPFFTQLLESQKLTQEEIEAVSGGLSARLTPKENFKPAIPLTLRYPSDNDGLTTSYQPSNE